MITVITVTEQAPQGGGRYQCHYKTGVGKTVRSEAGYGPESAAATAMRIALNVPGRYAIFGPKPVLDCIPAELRARS